MKRLFFLVSIILFVLPLMADEFVIYTQTTDTVRLPEVEVSVSRVDRPVMHQQMQVSVIDPLLIDKSQILSPKDISNITPNIYMPDYGSAMTSSIYIRGMGSRINEPVMAMVVDGVPLMDKNMYDQALQDVKRIELIRGAQGSLYGRNSPAGVMEIRTLQPLDLTTRLIKGSFGYASANTIQAQASYYDQLKDNNNPSRLGWGIAARYKHTDGFYTNDYDGRRVDGGEQAGGKIVIDSHPTDQWQLSANVYADWVKQGAFPYASVKTHTINYNRPSGYERLAVMPTLRAQYQDRGYKLLMSAAYQLLNDNMLMDQDYTQADIFTLQQKQQQHSQTLDALLKGKKNVDWYDWSVGVSEFVKHNNMYAPVTFMRQGIEEVILGNANRGIQTAFPDDSLCISNNQLPIPSYFTLFNAGLAAYHQSHFRFGNWHINADLRFDYEYASMDYLSTAQLDYKFTLITDQFTTINTLLQGNKHSHFWQILPRLAASYDDDWGTVYVSAAKGYKAGGYNPQIFSTITQNQVMTDIAAVMGMHLDMTDPRFSDVSITEYKPERDWNFEVGAHFTPLSGIQIDIAGFHTQCYDQQVTVFPNGKTTGRMMANAARSRIWGAEATLHYRWNVGNWQGILVTSYGFTDARFIKFNDGMGDYSGNYIPYSPMHTAHILANVEYVFNQKWLKSIDLTINADGIGQIYWNEQNDCVQPFYGLLNANLSLKWKYLQLTIWGKNLTNTQYDVFYFRSMGNDFLQKGKPLQLGATISVNL